ncbi:MAG: dienelactone hydrolase family protein [Vicinamibacterales bacterium]
MPADPHGAQPVLHAGVPLGDARLAVIMVHGRGAGADDMLGLAAALRVPDVAYLAPQAAGNTWYPYPFMTAMERNEPGLSSGLAKIGALVAATGAEGMPPERVVLLGFSQGACLSLEFAARHARRYAAVVALSGGLIGPHGTPRDYPGSFEGTPAFLGCSDVDPHIPIDRVHEAAEVFRRMQADVDERIYPRMGHTVNADEIAAVRALLRGGAGL